jgi:hypothetical protein
LANLGRYIFTIRLIFSYGVIGTGILNGALIKIIDGWVLQLKKQLVKTSITPKS